MMMAEGIVIMKYELWYIHPALLGLAGVFSWLLLLLHTGYFSGISEGVLSVCGSLLQQCFLVRE